MEESVEISVDKEASKAIFLREHLPQSFSGRQ
jgi:hypothetical protein